LLDLADLEVFHLWKACRKHPHVVMRRVGRRYLRFDKQVEDYARLSPSIRREFLIYTVVGLTGQMDQIAARCLDLQHRFIRISQHKRELARDFVRFILRIKQLVREFGVPQKLAQMEEKATREREIAERELCEDTEQGRAWLNLFFTEGGRADIC
jgi:hypothetical protein